MALQTVEKPCTLMVALYSLSIFEALIIGTSCICIAQVDVLAYAESSGCR